MDENKKDICNCGHMEFCHDKDGCHHEEYVTAKSSGGYIVGYTKLVTCSFK